MTKCLDGITQNQNTSFHSTVWQRASTTDCTSGRSIHLAVDLAVANFYVGKEAGFSRIMTGVGVEPGLCAKDMFSSLMQLELLPARGRLPTSPRE